MIKISLKFVCSQGSTWQYAGISSDSGLAPNRWQAIIWSNNDLCYQCIYASLDLNELTTTRHSADYKVRHVFFKVSQTIITSNYLHVILHGVYYTKWLMRSWEILRHFRVLTMELCSLCTCLSISVPKHRVSPQQDWRQNATALLNHAHHQGDTNDAHHSKCHQIIANIKSSFNHADLGLHEQLPLFAV